MEYKDPEGSLRQTELTVEDEGDSWVLFDTYRKLWEPAQTQKAPVSLRFLTHACMEFSVGPHRLITDPWLVGPAFSRGWWLQHDPPSKWWERFEDAWVYVSHNHSDHLNTHTLQALLERSVQPRFLVPDFPTKDCERPLRQMGFQNVEAIPLGSWREIDETLRLMILPDGAGRHDSSLLLDAGGLLVFNNVDCANPNGGDLPHVDVMMSSFAGGASGYPVCWEDQYGRAEVRRRTHRSRGAELDRVAGLARTTQPRLFVPIAGYFTEAHPADAGVRELNQKNRPEEVVEAVKRAVPGIASWIPDQAELLDLHTESSRPAPFEPEQVLPRDAYTAPIDAAMEFAPLQSLDGVQQYFDWAGFQDNLVLHIVETDEPFATELRSYLVDFQSGQITPERPNREHRYLRMRVRASVLRYVMRHGLPWEEISIGFQARFARDPEVYNLRFWEHFQIRLPGAPPWPDTKP